MGFKSLALGRILLALMLVRIRSCILFLHHAASEGGCQTLHLSVLRLLFLFSATALTLVY